MHRLDLAGAIALPAMSGAVVYAQQTVAAASGDVSLSATELAIIGVLLSSMVAALVFVHRLLMQSQTEIAKRQEEGWKAVVAAKEETIHVLQTRVDALVEQNTRVTELADHATQQAGATVQQLVESNKQSVQVLETLRERMHALINSVHAQNLAGDLQRFRESHEGHTE